jgi:hypothetical protein
LKKSVSFRFDWHLMLPQFGSTMIIGITLYVFRLMILLITGKEVAGDLFAAFALGGMLGSIYAQVLGPSVVLYENRSTKSFFSPRINVSLGLTVLAGIILFVFSQMGAHFLAISNKSNFFWGSVGASMIGGVIMVYAQQIRFRLLQLHEDNNLFGPDLLINLLIVASVPYLYYIVGKDTLMILYMISAMLAYMFYWSSEKQDTRETQDTGASSRKIYMAAITFFVLLPIFFQIESGIFNDPAMIYDSGGALRRLPLPLSVLVCIIGILLLGRYKRAYLSLSYIFFSFILMLIASLVSTGNHSDEIQAKLILLLQFILPMAALVLGQLYESQGESPLIISKVFLCIILMIVPLQLLSTWNNGTLYLFPKVYFFSIYQHLQYVPVIFVSAYLIVVYSLWQWHRFRKVLLILIPIMGVYTAVSISMSALLLFYTGTTGLIVYYYKKSVKSKSLVLAVMIAFLLSTGYLYLGKNIHGSLYLGSNVSTDAMALKYEFLKLEQSGAKDYNNIPILEKFQIENISTRIYYWKYHIQKSMSGAKEFVFGNSHRPDRQIMSSAHNYYIDLLYNFGFISLVPVLALIVFTAAMLYRYRVQIILSPECFCLAFIVTFLILLDNSLKVGLRQPYPGIFTFFIWGILLTKLMSMSAREDDKSETF